MNRSSNELMLLSEDDARMLLNEIKNRNEPNSIQCELTIEIKSLSLWPIYLHSFAMQSADAVILTLSGVEIRKLA